MKLLILLFVLLLEGCGGYAFDCEIEISAGGMNICFENEKQNLGISKQMIEETVYIVQEETRKHYPQVTNLKYRLDQAGTDVFFTTKDLAQDCKRPRWDIPNISICDGIGGFNTNGNFIVVKYYGCGSLKLLEHEILHSIEIFYLNDFTNDHKMPYMFNEPLDEDDPAREVTIETLIANRINEMCWPEDDS